MLRKLVIALCALGTIASASTWAASHMRFRDGLKWSNDGVHLRSGKQLYVNGLSGAIQIGYGYFFHCGMGLRDDQVRVAGFVLTRTYYPSKHGTAPSFLGSHCSVNIPLWFPTVAFAALPAFTLLRIGSRRRRWREKHGLCVACGYSLTGNLSGGCPECGTIANPPTLHA